MSSHVEDSEGLVFEAAAERMRANTSIRLSNEQKLEIYGYYKQATEGPCTTSKPGFFDFQGRAKWEAWHNQRHLSKEQAKKSYIELVDKLDPNWRHTPLTPTDQIETNKPNVSSSSGLSGPVVSRMADCSDTSDNIPDTDKTLVDWASEGSLERVTKCLREGENINMKDGEGMTPLHWASDRGHLELVKCLVEHGADLNIKDGEGQTPLHYATSCGHRAVITYLLSQEADTTVLDNEGQTPVDVSDKTVKDLFQK